MTATATVPSAAGVTMSKPLRSTPAGNVSDVSVDPAAGPADSTPAKFAAVLSSSTTADASPGTPVGLPPTDVTGTVSVLPGVRPEAVTPVPLRESSTTVPGSATNCPAAGFSATPPAATATGALPPPGARPVTSTDTSSTPTAPRRQRTRPPLTRSIASPHPGVPDPDGAALTTLGSEQLFGNDGQSRAVIYVYSACRRMRPLIPRQMRASPAAPGPRRAISPPLAGAAASIAARRIDNWHVLASGGGPQPSCGTATSTSPVRTS